MKKTNFRWHHIILRFPNDKNALPCAPWVALADSPAHYLVANEVFWPLLRKYRRQLPLWRFHRMFVPRKDSEFYPTNEFKFKFYSTPKTWRNIDKGIRNNYLVKKLQEKRIITNLESECSSSDSTAAVGSDNDRNWSYAMKEVWPFYIHGVSVAWLRLLRHHYQNLVKESYSMDASSTYFDPEESLKFYHKVSLAVYEDWGRWGCHAFFHHASGVFGYNPILFKRRVKDVRLKKDKKFWKGKNRIISGMVKF